VDYLRDIVDAAGKARRFVEGLDFAAFQRNDEKVFAVVRALEIIGEAARQVPASVRARHHDLAWKDIAGMRDKLIHDYFGVDLEVVWRTVHEDLPPLLAVIEHMLSESP
jgi:uncharacterized protein with HEPN domain